MNLCVKLGSSGMGAPETTSRIQTLGECIMTEMKTKHSSVKSIVHTLGLSPELVQEVCQLVVLTTQLDGRQVILQTKDIC